MTSSDAEPCARCKEGLQWITQSRAAEVINARKFKWSTTSTRLGTTTGDLVVDPSELCYWAWPETFGSTAGPFGGCGGQQMTTFTIEAWEAHGQYAVLFCRGRILRITDKFQPMMGIGR
jgi:hypothetical protein